MPVQNHFLKTIELSGLNSGTASLALSILIAKNLKKISNPEVIVPAYACPDLVAACAYAGVKCRLCDLAQNNTSYDINLLESLINENTIALAAINFLGIQERISEIFSIVQKKDILLIEDNAQWFPELNNSDHLTGDFICLSFGRGKPVSLLGGGCLLVKETILQNDPIEDLIKTIVHQNNDSKFFGFFC